jgi:hypothetical protein
MRISDFAIEVARRDRGKVALVACASDRATAPSAPKLEATCATLLKQALGIVSPAHPSHKFKIVPSVAVKELLPTAAGIDVSVAIPSAVVLSTCVHLLNYGTGDALLSRLVPGPSSQ